MKDICTVNKQIKFSLEWIYFFFILILCSLESEGPKHMSDKAAARIGCLNQLQATAQGWAGWVFSP